MKCYFREGDGEWVKGHIYNVNHHCLRICAEKGKMETGIDLYNAEVRFYDTVIVVAGYSPREDGSYQPRSFDVSGGWVKPRA